MTGRSVQAATTPGRWAAPPAAAITTLRPRSRAVEAQRITPCGSRWAEQTLSSASSPSSSSWRVHASIRGRSDLLPRMTPTSGKFSDGLHSDVGAEVGSRKSYPAGSGQGRLAGRRGRVPEGHHREHAPARRDQPAAGLVAGAGVEDDHALRHLCQALDRVTGPVLAGIAARGDNDSDRGLGLPAQVWN